VATGTPFSPTPFTSTVVAPVTASLFRRVSYCSPSEFRFAPTAVATMDLVQGSTNAADQTASLAQVLARASSWADLICFHRSDGSLQASLTTESDWVKPKADGSLCLVCNFKPVTEVVGLGVGSTPSGLGNVTSSTAADIWIDGPVIWVPSSWSVSANTTFPRPIGYNASLYAVWQYISGYPNTSLTANVAQGATTITVSPSTVGGTTVAGIYPGSPLTIVDGAETETVVASAAPTGLTVSLASGTAYAHNVPAAPDFIRVTAMPAAATEAVILLAACLIKTRGTRAMQMPHAPGQMPRRPMLAQAGAEAEYDMACKLLSPFTTVMLHG